MKYMGSKARIASEILPLILKGRREAQYYVEPFCGGCNTIDKVDGNRIANDNNPYLIRMWQCLVDGWKPPTTIERDYYNDVRECYNQKTDAYILNYIGWVGFMGSYNGRFFDGGYSGHHVKIKNGFRDYIGEAIRNTLAQVPALKSVVFLNRDYKDLVLPACSIIYCDPPYKDVKRYSYHIDHDEFWQWCRNKVAEGHKVFVSEYNAPEDFVCIWQGSLKTTVNQTITKNAVERLFVHESQVLFNKIKKGILWKQ